MVGEEKGVERDLRNGESSSCCSGARGEALLASRSARRCCERECKVGDLKKDVRVVATAWERARNFVVRVTTKGRTS